MMRQQWKYGDAQPRERLWRGLGRPLGLLMLSLVWVLPAVGQERIIPENHDIPALLDAWQSTGADLTDDRSCRGQH